MVYSSYDDDLSGIDGDYLRAAWGDDFLGEMDDSITDWSSSYDSYDSYDELTDSDYDSVKEDEL